MRRLFLPFVLLVGACSDAAPADFDQSACSARMFEGSRFTACSASGGRIEVRTGNAGGAPYRGFVPLEAALGKRASQVAFAMNAGMFDAQGRAIGLLVEDGKTLHPINLRNGGGNFHLMPNGVFLVRRSRKAEVVTSPRYKAAKDIAFATQSGPMLVIDGKLHPQFEPDGQSRNIRNGVGITRDGTAVFAISEDPVSFGRFARFFRDSVKARNALYFDGSVSSLWDPAGHRRDVHSELGPIVLVFRPAVSAPGRASPATP